MVNGKGPTRGSARHGRRDRLIQEFQHDPYKSRAKPREPTVCPECGVMFHKGRWQWVERPQQAHETLCPACHRRHDRYPGGFLTLTGPFLQEHRDEILHLARNVESREKAEHPLRRIMELEDRGEQVEITTTTMELARAIGDAVQHAYKGDLNYQYTQDSNILRVDWRR
jgi:NMD protein affecting ribosome stability and mRNA decay